jgi:SAM-dependent methyltransferase
MSSTEPSSTDRLAATRRLWTLGDYASMGELWAAAGATLVDRLGVADLDVLDVATGTGGTALAAAGGAARVVGLDATPSLLAEAGRRCTASGLDVDWEEGDMETLPFPDRSFDRVLSSFGAMFAVDQAGLAAELVRVCRPGGRIGLTAWTDDSVFSRMTEALMNHLPPPPPGAPQWRQWGRHDELERIFADLPVQITVERSAVACFLASADAAVARFETESGPIMTAKEALDSTGGWEAARADLVEVFRAAGHPEVGKVRFDLGYARAIIDIAN